MKNYTRFGVLRSFSIKNFRQAILIIFLLLITICSASVFSKKASMQSPTPTPTPPPPVANSDTYTGVAARHQNAPGVLANDTFYDRNLMYAAAATNPQYGTLSWSFDGSFNYSPNGSYPGSDSFTYYACASGYTDCQTATVNLIKANTAPVTHDVFYNIGNPPDRTWTLYPPGLQGEVFDPEGDSMSFAWSDGPQFGSFTQSLGATTVGYGYFQGQSGLVSIKELACDNLGLCSNFMLYLWVAGDDQANAGASCPLGNVGKPVNVSNGNMWIQQTDYNLSSVGQSIDVTRTYNSINQASGLFGFGWSSPYDQYLSVINDKIVRVYLSDGRAVHFVRNDTSSPFKPIDGKDFHASIVKNTNESYLLTHQDGRKWEFNQNGTLLSLSDRNNNQTTLNYDTYGTLTGITDAFGRTLTVGMNSGLISQISDSIGTIATYEYYPSTSLLKTVSYRDGSKYKFEYTTVGSKTYLATVKDALDNIFEHHEYDTQGRATTSEKQGGVEKYTLDYTHINDAIPYTTVTDALSRITKYYFESGKGRNIITKVEGNCGCGSGSEATIFEYDSELNLTKKTDGNGHIKTYTYDQRGNMLTETEPGTGTRSYTYNNFGEVLTATDAMNGTSTVTYNSTGNPTQITDSLSNSTNFTYNTKGQVLTVTDPRNKTTSLTWTGANLTKQTDANAKETNFTYDARGRLQTVTDPLNHTTTYQYDLNNRIKKIIYPDATFEEFTYDLAGRRINAKDARGNITTFGYDNAYRLTTVTDPLNHTATIGYDLMSNRTSVTDALNHTTNFEFDSFNRLKKTIYPEITPGGTRLNEQLFYDAVGNLKKRTDTAGRDTLYDYDDANRLIETTDANLQITQFEYNSRSQMTKVKDALNQEYTFTYDPLGHQLSQTRAGTTMSYEYDAAGNRTKRTDYLGRVTDYTYDNLNRVTLISYANEPSSNASYEYDDLSRLTSAVNYAGTVSFTYDNRNRVKTSTDVFNHTVEYGYDENGNRNLLKLDGATHATYVYDTANRLTQLEDETNQDFTFGYDAANRLITKTLLNNGGTSYDYDGMSRLKELKHRFDTTVRFQCDPMFGCAPPAPSENSWTNSYTYNSANQISQINQTSQTDGLELLSEDSTGNPISSFSYDNVDRLTAATYSNSNQPNETYSFDSVGNRNSSHLSSTYGYLANNKLVSTQAGNYGYDANGSMISKTQGLNSWSYVWDYENRMKSATKGTLTVGYKYDALGRRIKRIDPSGSITKFTYDGLNVVMDDDTVTGITKYQNGLGIDEKLKMTNGTDTKYFLQDHLGSTAGLVDSSGNLTASTTYDSFGNATNTNFPTRYQFTGREFDNLTGLTYYRARWYDANLGRFISEDPIGFAGGDVNLFGYVKNNPLMYFDPEGTQRLDATWKTFSPEDARNLRRAIDAIPEPVGGEERFQKIMRCHDNNKFSSLMRQPYLRYIPYGEGGVELLEVGSLLSLGADGIATYRKLGHGTASSNPYGSGINMVTKDATGAIGLPRIGGSPIRKFTTPIGDTLTPIFAVTGAFTFSYNTTVDVQCICGQLE